MNWKQAVLTALSATHRARAHAAEFASGRALWNSFPCPARASFGVLGANVAAVLRALVACGWFGIQSWIGGEAINTLLGTVWPAWQKNPNGVAICFAIFWVINLLVMSQGHRLHPVSAGRERADSSGRRHSAAGVGGGSSRRLRPMLAAPSSFATTADFLKFLIPAFERNGRLLVHGFAEHSGLHPLSPKMSVARPWDRPSPCRSP